MKKILVVLAMLFLMATSAYATCYYRQVSRYGMTMEWKVNELYDIVECLEDRIINLEHEIESLR